MRRSLILSMFALSGMASACTQPPPSQSAPPQSVASEPGTRTASTAKYAADVPASIVTPDTVQTRVGTLKFSDGLPDDDTVRKVYDNLDFTRGVEAFMAGVPATSVEALKRGSHWREESTGF